jgi:hypothetical protein
MPRYDSTTKNLVQTAPLDWVILAGFPNAKSARIIDTDVSTITAQADKVILVDELLPWIVHIEFQAAYDPKIGLRQCRYNVLLEYRHAIPVISVLVLLSLDADGSSMSGTLRRSLPDGTCYDEFRYHVVRVWELPVESVLSGGLGTLPLAPLSGIPESQLPGIIQRMKSRIDQEVPSAEERNLLWESTTILLGMRLPFEAIKLLLQGVVNMKESSVVQGFLEEGELNGERNLLTRYCERHFGKADQKQLSQIGQLTDRRVIEELVDRVREVQSWDEFLALLTRLQTRE